MAKSLSGLTQEQKELYFQGYEDGRRDGERRMKEKLEYEYLHGFRNGQIEATAPILKMIADHEARILRPIIIYGPKEEEK